jgi:hypothetical protein
MGFRDKIADEGMPTPTVMLLVVAPVGFPELSTTGIMPPPVI